MTTPIDPRILVGDCLDRLAELPDNSIHAVVTDPPYGLSDLPPAALADIIVRWASGERDAVPNAKGMMGLSWDGFVPPPAVWDECLRVLKPGGHLLAFSGTRTFGLMDVAIRLAGLEARDLLAWLTAQGFPKSMDLGKTIAEAAGRGTALKPAVEPIGLYRKGLQGTVAATWLAHGTGALNIDACRIGSEQRTYDLTMTPGNFEPTGGGLNVKSGTATVTGRFPANLVLAHTPDCEPAGTADVKASGNFPARRGVSHFGFASGQETPGGARTSGNGDGTETVELWRCADGCPVAELDRQSGPNRGAAAPVRRGHSGKSRGVYGDYAQRGDDGATFYGDTGGASRFFFVAKPSTREREHGLEHLPLGEGKKRRNTHISVKPVTLMRYLLRLAVPPGGVVLDPFLGSGTTAVAAILEGVDWLGCEREADYLPIIAGRIAQAERDAAEARASLQARAQQTDEVVQATLFDVDPAA